MKKTTFIILFIYLFSIISTRDSCYLGYDNDKNEPIEPSSVKDCTDYELKDEEKDEGDTCCYVERKEEGDTKTKKRCYVYNKKGVTKKGVEAEMKEEGYTELSIDCGSHWLSITLISTFFILLF